RVLPRAARHARRRAAIRLHDPAELLDPVDGLVLHVPDEPEPAAGAKDAVNLGERRIASTGSTATTNAPVGTRRRVSFPVPAARSSTRLPSSSPSSATSRSIASGGYGGLPISYGLGACSKPRAAWWIVPARELTRRTG